jgi:hypothetical protein
MDQRSSSRMQKERKNMCKEGEKKTVARKKNRESRSHGKELKEWANLAQRDLTGCGPTTAREAI